MFHLQNYKTIKANVQISAVRKEFKNGQQGWQVFVEGMEGRLRCEMNFKDALKAIRYCFVLSKRLSLEINDVQLAALSLDYQRAKEDAHEAQIAEEAVATAEQVAGEEEAEQFESTAPKSEEAPEEERPVSDSPLFKQFCDLKKKHPDALLLFHSGDFYECYEEDAIKAAEVLCLTEIHNSEDNVTIAGFPHHALDTYLPKLIRAGLRVAICDLLEAPKPKKQRVMQPLEIVTPVQQELFTE